MDKLFGPGLPSTTEFIHEFIRSIDAEVIHAVMIVTSSQQK